MWNSGQWLFGRRSKSVGVTDVLPFALPLLRIYELNSCTFQCVCGVGVVVGVLFYRMSVLAALHLHDNPLIHNNAAIVASVTGAVINVFAMFILDFVSRAR